MLKRSWCWCHRVSNCVTNTFCLQDSFPTSNQLLYVISHLRKFLEIGRFCLRIKLQFLLALELLGLLIFSFWVTGNSQSIFLANFNCIFAKDVSIVSFICFDYTMTFCDNASVWQLINDCIFSPPKYNSFQQLLIMTKIVRHFTTLSA